MRLLRTFYASPPRRHALRFSSVLFKWIDAIEQLLSQPFGLLTCLLETAGVQRPQREAGSRPGADDHVAEANPLGGHRQRGELENDSNVISSVGSGTVVKWSKTQANSKPSSSAWRARSTVLAHASAGSKPSYSPFQPWGISRPTCNGCLLHERRIVRRGVPVARRDLVLFAARAAAYPLPMPEPAFDPTAPLAPAPEPWASTTQPSRRDGRRTT